MCIIEGFVPGFGVFGILGMLMEIAGVVTYAILNNDALQIFILLMLVVLLFLILFFVFVRSAKYGLLAKTPFVENETAVSTDYAEKEKQALELLVGKSGKALTDCRPVGSAKIGEDIFEVRARGKIIHKGENVEVIEISDNNIIVDKEVK